MYTIQELQTLAKQYKSVLHTERTWHKKCLQPTLNQFTNHEVGALLFLGVEHPIDLCRLLGKSINQLEKLLSHPKYIQYSIAKKRGGRREILAPAAELKDVQKRVNYFLQGCYLSIKPKEVHGFIINPPYLNNCCNIVTNAQAHIEKGYVLNIDLKEFFPNIAAKQIKQLFSSPVFGFTEQIATALTLLATFEGRLPVGAPTSPVISNFICYDLDKLLIAFCGTHSLTYTRYADDLTFSANQPIVSDMVLDISSIINKAGFDINEKKLRLQTKKSRQVVTGLTVNRKVNIDRKLLKKIRAMLHDFTCNGISKATKKHFQLVGNGTIDNRMEELFIQRLKGYINFVGQVRGKDDFLYTRYNYVLHSALNPVILQ